MRKTILFTAIVATLTVVCTFNGKLHAEEAAEKGVKYILLSGFEPFGGHTFNTSYDAIAALEGRKFGEFVVKVIRIPVVWHKAEEAVFSAMEKYAPWIVICSGMGTEKITIESTARNRTKKILDNNKEPPPPHGKIIENGPETLATRLPIARLIKALSDEQIEVVEGRQAGGFLCEWVFYKLMHKLVEGRSEVVGGFIHVPIIKPEDEKLKTVTRAYEIILQTLVKAVGENQAGDETENKAERAVAPNP